MRVIEAFDEPVQAVAASPDGRFVAAAAGSQIAVFDWFSGESLVRARSLATVGQLVFTHDGQLVLIANRFGVFRLAVTSTWAVPLQEAGFSGGIAVSPDGRLLVATRAGQAQQVILDQWELPGWKQKSGIDFWSPFDRLAFSPDGEHIAGINRDEFELRFGNSFGLNRREASRKDRYLPPRFRRGSLRDEPARSAFFSFSRYSETVVFGWDGEFQVMETHAGNILKRAASPGAPFVDAAFVGTGHYLATADGTDSLRIWSTDSGEIVRAYEWGVGGVACVTTTADGLACICGTDAGRIVVFDVDD